MTTPGYQPSITTQVQNRSGGVPTQLLVYIQPRVGQNLRKMAYDSLKLAHLLQPKLTKASYRGLRVTWNEQQNYIGFQWSPQFNYLWYQEQGIRSFVMKSLAGKTIPMWISDPTGKMRSQNPKARTRTTESGVTQVLIFRKVAKIGQNKTPQGKWKSFKKTPQFQPNSPAHEPGQPGRIERRKTNFKTPPPQHAPTGQIAKGNVGQWWTHPGLRPRQFMNTSLTQICNQNQARIIRMVAQ